MTQSSLDSLREHTTIVVDSADFDILPQYRARDVTTNPLHILTACKNPRYHWILRQAAEYGLSKSSEAQKQSEAALLRLLVTFGTEILKLVPGRTSTEVDPIYSFDKENTIRVAREIIDLYEEMGVSRDRVLIKIVATWEGFQAARVLEKEHGIHCNMTAIFSLHQAVLAAECGCTLVSPFVARTSDWYQKHRPGEDYTGWQEPGVKLVADIHNYYAAHGYATEIMAASLRTVDQISLLSGLRLMTLSEKTLSELQSEKMPMTSSMASNKYKSQAINGNTGTKYLGDESAFRFALFQDQAATEKLHESIRIFLDAVRETNDILRTAMGTL